MAQQNLLKLSSFKKANLQTIYYKKPETTIYIFIGSPCNLAHKW